MKWLLALFIYIKEIEYPKYTVGKRKIERYFDREYI